ncbi:mannose-1-phosphate guanylyltransferase [Paenibacillus rigui]|uniref:Mannose-1-phosphate guanylyltransferase n=1 Tax=Paenibacillus rigui TaxID=554312 RepID=A0A229UTE7_9BACL|nr:sugar phosphate nucleotidyltransferase [Paenibacillus rigui]OXM86708.1 mannose-1-phosphate guanylyltransferase [Paenibacillus rigui]
MKIVIMAGGMGSRFWPRSVAAMPKQFLAMQDAESLLQQTYRRFAQFIPKDNIYVVTAQRYVSLVNEQLPDLTADRLLVEPDQRDTGPCIAFTAISFLKQGIDDVLVTAPSDQFIADGQALFDAVNEAVEAAARVPAIATLGIVPTRPETGYGYIHTSDTPLFGNVYPVRSFIEKPSLETARKLLLSRSMYWNSGIFVWRPSTIAFYMKKYQEALWHALTNAMDAAAPSVETLEPSQTLSNTRHKNRQSTDLAAVYKLLPKLSVDYAILEKAEDVYTIPVQFDWDDVGTWSSLQRFGKPDRDGNHLHGSIHTVQAKNNIVYSDKQSIIIGVQDLIIVSTKDGLLVCHQSDEHLIKQALSASGITKPTKEV